MKLRKPDSQFMWGRLFSPMWAIFHSLRNRSYPFECGAEQRFDLNNNLWLNFLSHVIIQQEQKMFEQAIWDFYKKVLGASGA